MVHSLCLFSRNSCKKTIKIDASEKGNFKSPFRSQWSAKVAVAVKMVTTRANPKTARKKLEFDGYQRPKVRAKTKIQKHEKLIKNGKQISKFENDWFWSKSQGGTLWFLSKLWNFGIEISKFEQKSVLAGFINSRASGAFLGFCKVKRTETGAQ